MISRKLRKYLAIIAGMLAAFLPVGLIHVGLDACIEHKASEDVRIAAQREAWRLAMDR